MTCDTHSVSRRGGGLGEAIQEAMLWGVPLFAFFRLAMGWETFFLLDVVHEHRAFQAIINRVLAESHARLPTWNPYSLCGTPLLADPQMQVCYPPALLYRFLPPSSAYGLFVLSHLILMAAGVRTFLCGRGAKPLVASFAGLSFALSLHSFLLATAAPSLIGLSWIPWMGVATDRLRGVRLADCLSVGIVLAWLILAGQPQYVMYGAGLGGMLLLCPWSLTGEFSWRRCAGFMLGCALGTLLAAVLLIPLMDYARQTTRGAPLPAHMRVVDDLNWQDLINYAFPYLAVPQYQSHVYFNREHWPRLNYLGILPVAAAATALWLRPFSRWIPQILMIVIGLCLARGSQFPIIGTIVGNIPGVSSFRHAALWMFLVNLGIVWMIADLFTDILTGGAASVRRIARSWISIALLPALFGVLVIIVAQWKLGITAGLRTRPQVIAAVHPFLVLLVMACILLWGWRRAKGWSFAFVALVSLADIVRAGFALQPVAPAEWVEARTEEGAFFDRAVASGVWFRGYVLPNLQANCYVEGKDLQEALAGIQGKLRSNLLASYGVRDMDGCNPLVPRSVDRVLASLKARPKPWLPPAKWALDFLGVRYIIAGEAIPDLGQPVFAGWVHVYENPGAQGPASLEQPEAGTILGVMGATPGRWEVDVELVSPSTLVIAETAVKGWRLRDGSEGARIREVYRGFLGVDLPVGSHRVVLEYFPEAVVMGFATSGGALLVVFVVSWISRATGRGRRPRRSSRSRFLPLQEDNRNSG